MARGISLAFWPRATILWLHRFLLATLVFTYVTEPKDYGDVPLFSVALV